MTGKSPFLSELKRRNVLRAAVLYAGTVWLLAQVITQLGPVLDAPTWIARWFLVAAVVGFPVWLAFAWFYEFTPGGLKRENEVASNDSIARSTGRKLDFWIIGVLAVAVVMLVTNQFVLRRDATSMAQTADASAIAAALAEVPEHSVAVLPLANESGDPKQQYFSDGLSEALISDLTQIDGLKVIGKYSSFKFRGSNDSLARIGATLGVRHLIEGSVRRQGGRVRVVVNLLRARDGSGVWSHTYDRQLKDIFAVQSDIADAVANALKVKLLGKPIVNEQRPPSGSFEAYQLMLQGRALARRSTRDDSRQGIALLRKALRIDPAYAYAWGLLSNYLINYAANFLKEERQRDAFAEARAAADRVARLAPDSLNAHLTKAYVLSRLDWDEVGALAEAKRALQRAPNDGVARALLAFQYTFMGQLQPAVELYRKAIATDPLRADWYGNLANVLTGLRQFDAAEQATRKALTLQADIPGAYTQLSYLDILRGDVAAAARDAKREPDPDNRVLALTAIALAKNDPAQADAMLHAYIGKYGKRWPYTVASLYAQYGKPDEMFAWLDRAWAQRDGGLTNLLSDPSILRYRHDPRFAAFCRKIGLLPPGMPSASSTLAASAGIP